MIGTGRPLRFLLLLTGGWIAVRTAMLWPTAEIVAERLLVEVGAPAAAIAADAMPPLPVLQTERVSIALPVRAHRARAAFRAEPRLIAAAMPYDAPGRAASAPPSTAMAAMGADPVGRAPAASPRRWTASVWLVARDGSGATLAPGGTLAGSQAGLRIAYRPFAESSAAVFGRMSSPLQARGAEAALGVEVQPVARIPVRVAIEQRFALEQGAAEGTAVSLIGGVSDVDIGGGVRIDGYGQAGVIGLRRRAGFVDGAVRAMRPVAAWRDGDLLVGAGAWGAAQPGLSRLDIGPRGEVQMPIASQRIRLGVEWRERITGNARPGSGPALTLGTDF